MMSEDIQDEPHLYAQQKDARAQGAAAHAQEMRTFPERRAAQKMKAGVFVMLSLLMASFSSLTLVLPLLIKATVIAEHPEYDQAKATSRAAFLKSTIDAGATTIYFLLAPIIGAMSDRRGRKFGFTIAFASAAMEYGFIIYAMHTEELWPLYAGGWSGSVTLSMFSLALAYMTDLSPPAEKGKNFGMVAGAIGAGVVIGPTVSGGLLTLGKFVPLYSFLVVLAATCACMLLFLPESKLFNTELPPKHWTEQANPFTPLKILFFGTSSFLNILGTVYFLYMLAGTALLSTIVLYVNFRYGWGSFEIGLLMGAAGILMVTYQAVILRYTLKYVTVRNVALVGVGIRILSSFAYAFSVYYWIMLVTMVLGMGGVLAGPAMQTIVSDHVPYTQQGAVMGSLASTQAVASFCGALLFGNLFSYFISDDAVIYFPGAQFFFGGVIDIVALGTLFYLFRRFPASQNQFKVLDEESGDHNTTTDEIGDAKL